MLDINRSYRISNMFSQIIVLFRKEEGDSNEMDGIKEQTKRE